MMRGLAAFQCITGNCWNVCGGQIFGDASPLGFSELPANKYIGDIRVPEPEEVQHAYPWMGEALRGGNP